MILLMFAYWTFEDTLPLLRFNVYIHVLYKNVCDSEKYIYIGIFSWTVSTLEQNGHS
jgi:hypothetical protein